MIDPLHSKRNESSVAATSELLNDLANRLRSSGTTILDEVRGPKARFGPAFAADEVAGAVEAALAEPLDYPPLSEAAIPGDRVVLAVDEGVPALEQVVVGTIGTLKNAGVEPGRVQVVVAEAVVCKRIEQTLADAGLQNVKVESHDPNDRDSLSFLGMTKDEKPLLLNRTIADADLVIPIGCARLDGVLGNAGIYGSVFPRFGDTENLQRWRKWWRNLGHDPREAQDLWRKQADEAGWMLGAPMVLEVVPGPSGAESSGTGSSGTVQQVLAGESRRVAKESLSVAEQVWAQTYAQPASLVVATMADRGAPPTWDDIARAVWAAEPVLAYDGALVLCCPALSRTSPRPGKSVSRLLDFDDLDRVQRELSEDAEADTWAAWQLAAALQRGPVYLMSSMEPDFVETLGMAPVESFDQLQRLASRHESCIVLEDAHHVAAAVTSVEGDDEGNDEGDDE